MNEPNAMIHHKIMIPIPNPHTADMGTSTTFAQGTRIRAIRIASDTKAEISHVPYIALGENPPSQSLASGSTGPEDLGCKSDWLSFSFGMFTVPTVLRVIGVPVRERFESLIVTQVRTIGRRAPTAPGPRTEFRPRGSRFRVFRFRV